MHQVATTKKKSLWNGGGGIQQSFPYWSANILIKLGSKCEVQEAVAWNQSVKPTGLVYERDGLSSAEHV